MELSIVFSNRGLETYRSDESIHETQLDTYGSQVDSVRVKKGATVKVDASHNSTRIRFNVTSPERLTSPPP